MRKRRVCVVLVGGLVACFALFVQNQATVAQQTSGTIAGEIDRLLAAEVLGESPAGMSLAPRTNDQVFLRRVSLDLVGQLPTPDEIAFFVIDPSATKRAALVERLLADARFGSNWGRYWRDVIIYRRAMDQALQTTQQLEPFLTDQLNRNVGWDKIASSFVEARGNVFERGETGLFMAQMAQTVDVAAETSRIFLGIQIQCAQCHDHPTDRWKRQQFHEFAAFFPRVGIQRMPATDGKPGLLLGSVDDVAQNQQSIMGRGRTLEHFMPDLKDPNSRGTMMAPVFFATGQRLETGALDADRRGSLSAWLTSKDNPWFAKAFVNRMWAELVGEGFYEPVDDLGPDRQCSAPRTMEYLASQFAGHDYDVKWLLQIVIATDAYQRESRPKHNPDQPPFSANVPQRLRADQLWDVVAGAVGFDPAAGGRGGEQPGRGAPSGPRLQFRALFGFDPSVRRDQIASSIPQALMLMNSPLLNQSSFRQTGTFLSALVSSTKDDEQVTAELFLRCLAREPNREEFAVSLEHVKSVGSRTEAFEDIFWSLLNSEELRYRN